MVEIPKGSRNKYEMDHVSGALWLDRLLFTATMYPTDYGFIASTLAEDGDPLDALVLLDEPTFPGCHIHVRPIGVMRMLDEQGVDAKVLCVPSTDPRWEHVSDIGDVARYLLDEITHFFEVYKVLEPTKHTTPGDWEGSAAAEAVVQEAQARYGRAGD